MKSYFEDSYLTWEMVPKANSEFIQKTLNHLMDLVENDINTWKHSETSDYYFNKRPIGGERPFPTSGLSILVNDFEALLMKFGLVRDVNRDFVDDQSMEDYRDEIEQSVSFSNQSYAVFYTSENGIVKHIWLDAEDYISHDDERAAIGELLHFLGTQFDFILVNWYLENSIDLSDKHKITETLNSIAKHNSSEPN